MVMDLRSKYNGLLEVMRLGFKQDNGEELTWKSSEFVDRIQALMKQFIIHGVPDENDFGMILGKEWNWEHYEKVLEELCEIGAINEFSLPIIEECEAVSKELEMIAEDKFYV